MSTDDTRHHNKRDRLLLTVKRDDDYPTIEATLTDADGEVIDLSDPGIATIEVHADHLETGTAVINATATIVDAPAGKVEYPLSSTETAREGRHNLEFVIQYTDGRTRTVPQSGYYYLEVDRPVSRGQLDPGTVDGSTSISVGYLSADEATIGTLSVTNAPVDADDAVRKAEHDTKADQTTVDSLSTTVGTKADKDGGGTATLSNYASMSTGELRHINSGTNEHTSDDRPLVSTTNRTLYVDPTTGNDATPTSDVSQTSPLATVQEALDRTPHLIQHEWVIDLATVPTLPVTHDAIPGSMVGPSSSQMGWAVAGDNSLFRIHGDTTAPSNVVINTSNLSLNIHNPEVEDPGAGANVHGLQIEGGLQCKGGQMGVSDCIFTGTHNKFGLGGKNSNIYAQNCEFRSGLTNAADAAHHQRVIFDNCSGVVSNYIANARSGGVVVDKGNNTIRGGEGSYSVDSGGSVIQDGTVLTKGPSLVDDFGDNRLTNRISMDSDPPGKAAGGYRPEWSPNQGSPTVQNNKLRLPAGNVTTQSVIRTQPYLTASHSFEFQTSTVPTAGALWYRFAYQGSSAMWMIFVRWNGDVYLRKGDAVGNTDIITGLWGGDTNTHTITANRLSGGNWELIIDGVSAGTAIDTFIPEVSTADRDMFITNTMDAAVDITNIRTVPY